MLKKLCIFTDLDGTLLDQQYSFEKAGQALSLIHDKGIPLIFCSSKTRAEIEQWRVRLDNAWPFIVENGGGIFVPKQSDWQVNASSEKTIEQGSYTVLQLGSPYNELRSVLAELRGEGFPVQGFGDMSAGEVSALTALSTDDAQRARMRDFDEPFVFKGTDDQLVLLKQRVSERGYRMTQGEFYHLTGDSDKGRAVDIVSTMCRHACGEITAIAIGDSPNDIEMMQAADIPIVVQKPDRSYHPLILEKVKNVIQAEGVGPAGWNRALIEIIQTTEGEERRPT